MFRTGEGEAEGVPSSRLGTLYGTHSTPSPGGQEASGLAAAAIALTEDGADGDDILFGGAGNDTLLDGGPGDNILV